MRTRTRIKGLFFIAWVAVYSGQANQAWPATGAGKETSAVGANVIDNDAPIKTSAPSSAGKSLTANQVSVSDAGTVEIHVNNASLLEVLRMLSLQSQKNIIASKDVSGTVTANLYNVTVKEALDAILIANGYAYREKGNFIFVYTEKEVAAMDKAARHLSSKVFRLFYIPAADAVSMIKPMLSADGVVVATGASAKGITTSSGESTGSSGGASSDTGGNSYAGNDMVVVTDDADKLGQIEQLIKEVDRRPQQVLIEATILAATLSDNNSLGVDFSLMGGVRFDQILSTPATAIQNAVTGNLQKPVAPTGTTTPGLTGYGIGNTSFPNGGLNIGILSNNISVFIQALESVTNTTVLANPKVMALDKQSAAVHVGSSDGYNTTTVTQTTSTQTVQLFDTGTILSFRPFVGDDGYIRMEIHPEDSTGGVVNGLPHKVITEVTSNVMIRDGHTIVIGGLFREQSQSTRSQVPGLGNIPFLGALFRQQQDTTTRQEIIILITPHIIKDESAYAALSEKEMKRVEELRVGVRKGMMISGRERLAEAAYQNALDELNKPRPNRNMAMWDLNVATNLNPTFLEAIELKEKLSGKQVTDVDNSSIRSFVARAVLADAEPATAPPATKELSRKVSSSAMGAGELPTAPVDDAAQK